MTFKRFSSVIEESSSQLFEEDNEAISPAVLNQMPQSERPVVQAVLQHQLERIRRMRSISSNEADQQGPSEKAFEDEAEPSVSYFHVNEVVDIEETNRNSL